MIQIIQAIASDMLEPIGYLPLGFAAGGVFLILWAAAHRGRSRGLGSAARRKWVLFLCVVYSAVLLNLAFFSREPGSRDTIDLRLFGTWGTNAVSHAFFIENILLFIPFGVLFSAAFRRLQNGWLCVLAGFLASVSLETMQLLTERGHCQLDDVVTNTVGTAIGWGISRWIRKMEEERRPRREKCGKDLRK